MVHKSTTTRVSPSIKAQAITNRRDLRNWELRFGLIPLVCFLGFVCAGIAGGFYLGYKTGHSIGHESAQTANLQNEARLPVAATGDNSDEAMPDLYAKLSQKKLIKVEEAAPAVEGDLSIVKSIDESPPVFPAADAQLGELKEPSAAKTDMAKVSSEDLVSGSAPSTETAQALEKTMGNPLDPKAQADLSLDAATGEKSPPAKLGSLVDENKIKPIDVIENNAAAPEKVALKSAVPEEKAAPAPKAKEPEAKEVAKKEPEAAKASNSFTKKVLRKGWYAQVAAPKKLKDADDTAKRLKSSGFSVAIETAQVRGEEYYRVVVGPEESRAQADRLAEQLKRESYLKGDPFVRAVK